MDFQGRPNVISRFIKNEKERERWQHEKSTEPDGQKMLDVRMEERDNEPREAGSRERQRSECSPRAPGRDPTV